MNLLFTQRPPSVKIPIRTPLYQSSCFRTRTCHHFGKVSYFRLPDNIAFLPVLIISEQVSCTPVYLNIFPNDMMTAASQTQQTVLLPCLVGRDSNLKVQEIGFQGLSKGLIMMILCTRNWVINDPGLSKGLM